MNNERVDKVIFEMKNSGLNQMLISDKASIFYLTGIRLYDAEGLLVLLVKSDGYIKLFLSEFYKDVVKDDVCVYFRGISDGLEKIKSAVYLEKVVGVDSVFEAGYLLKLMKIGINFCDTTFVMDNVRIVKDEVEQEFMRESSRLNDIAITKLAPMLSSGLTEKQLAKKLKKIYDELGCEGFSFDPIVAFGKNAVDPHHTPDDTVGKPGEMVVVDIGCYKNGYASDMTRTFFVGYADGEAKKIYEIVKEANLRGIAMAMPGVRMCDVDFVVRSYIEKMGYGKYFTHTTGHSIGLCVHENGSVSQSNKDVIVPGQCFSVEPGIYIPEKGIGVRIEDLVLITENGCELLNHVCKEITIV